MKLPMEHKPENKERLARSIAWLGCGMDLRGLDENVEREIWFYIIKDPEGMYHPDQSESYPYTTRAAVTPGELESLFCITRPSNFTVTVLTFENVDLWKLYEKEDTGYDEMNLYNPEGIGEEAALSRVFIEKLRERRRTKEE